MVRPLRVAPVAVAPRPTEPMRLFGNAPVDPLAALEDDEVFDPSMQTLLDSVSGMQGTATGTTYDAGLDARVFDGTSGHMLEWGFGGWSAAPVTLSLWVSLDDISTTPSIITTIGTAGGAIQLDVSTAGRLRFVHQGGTVLQRQSANATLAGDSAWRHIVVTSEGDGVAANVRLYVDGTEATYAFTQDGATLRDITTFRIGSAAGVSPDGAISDPRAWSRVLTPAEVATLYASLTAPA